MKDYDIINNQFYLLDAMENQTLWVEQDSSVTKQERSASKSPQP